ncbi:hypothetical protein, partial [Escherichia coli]|uniref:hypothetical protein n=1 Tax=Escherichia coli TaxID=562 RepID=UPI00050AC5FF
VIHAADVICRILTDILYFNSGKNIAAPQIQIPAFPCSQPDILDISGIRILLCYTRSDVYVLRPVKGNPINISWGGESIRGNGGAVRWQSIRRPVYRFP